MREQEHPAGAQSSSSSPLAWLRRRRAASAIDIAAMSHTQNQNSDPVAFDLGNDPIIAHPKSPQVTELRSFQRRRQSPWIIRARHSGFEEVADTALNSGVKLANGFRSARSIFNRPVHDRLRQPTFRPTLGQLLRQNERAPRPSLPDRRLPGPRAFRQSPDAHKSSSNARFGGRGFQAVFRCLQASGLKAQSPPLSYMYDNSPPLSIISFRTTAAARSWRHWPSLALKLQAIIDRPAPTLGEQKNCVIPSTSSSSPAILAQIAVRTACMPIT